MANLLYANNAAGTLSAGITNVATSLALNAGQGARFPLPIPPQVFYVTLTDAATQSLIEIVQVTARAGDILSIVRAQDGTSALSWNAGDIVSERAIRLEMQGWENAAEGLFGATGQNVAITPSTTLGIVGTTLADNAVAGSVGEFMNVAVTGVALVSTNSFNAGSVALTPGDWDVQAVGQFRPAGTTTLTVAVVSVSPNSNSLSGTFFNNAEFAYSNPNGNSVLFSTAEVRVNVAVPTTVFCVVNASFSGGACTADGYIRARRVR